MPVGKILTILLTAALPASACAQDYAVTIYGGYRGGGHFSDADTGKNLGLESNGAVSLALDIPFDASRQYQVFLSHQHTQLALDSAPVSGTNRLPMDITYLHAGGTSFFDGEVGKGVYAVGGLGATFFHPGQGYKSELYPSINVGLGYQLPLGSTLAVRLEARGYGTLVNSRGGVFCSGGCVVSIKGDVLTQGELMLGLSARF